MVLDVKIYRVWDDEERGKGFGYKYLQLHPQLDQLSYVIR